LGGTRSAWRSVEKNSRASFGEDKLIAEMLDEPGAELRRVRFLCEGSIDETLAEIGSTPLPPYIKRPGGVSTADRERYQTVYSKTAWRHCGAHSRFTFHTRSVGASCEIASIAEITLHVGYGTFEPVRVDDVDQHSVSGEHFEISASAARNQRSTRARRAE
jgi:S-adenosylmethionine:tRNA ribosyltransferase-isomerase